MTALRALPLVIIVGAVYLLLSQAALTKPIQWLRPPAFVPDSEIIEFTIHIPVNKQNRVASLGAFEGEILVQYSEIALAGETRRTLWPIKWRLPAGEIQIVAELRGIKGDGYGGVLFRDARTVRVYSRLGATTDRRKRFRRDHPISFRASEARDLLSVTEGTPTLRVQGFLAGGARHGAGL